MDITVTTMCNNDCLFCPKDDYLSLISRNTLKDIYQSIITTRNFSENIALSGGEITIFKKICDIIKFCKKLGFKRISVITNGRKLNDLNFAVDLIACGVNDFAVSIYSFNDFIHDKITRVSGSCVETKQGISNLILLKKKFDINVRVNLVLNFWNIADTLDTLKRLYSLGIKNYILAEQIQIGQEIRELQLIKIKDFFKKILSLSLKTAKITIKGFAHCFFEDVLLKNKKNSGIILKVCDPEIIFEAQNMDTFVYDCKNRSIYLKKIKKLYRKKQECHMCYFSKNCMGIQISYFK